MVVGLKHQICEAFYQAALSNKALPAGSERSPTQPPRWTHHQDDKGSGAPLLWGEAESWDFPLDEEEAHGGPLHLEGGCKKDETMFSVVVLSAQDKRWTGTQEVLSTSGSTSVLCGWWDRVSHPFLHDLHDKISKNGIETHFICKIIIKFVQNVLSFMLKF